MPLKRATNPKTIKRNKIKMFRKKRERERLAKIRDAQCEREMAKVKDNMKYEHSDPSWNFKDED